MPTYARRGDDDAIEVINVELAHRESAPDATRPWLITVDVPLLRPDERGLRDASEMEAVGDLHEDLAEALAPLGAVDLGRRTARGSTTFFFQAERHDGVDDLVAQAMRRDPEYTATTSVVSDPEWGTYLNHLCPDAYHAMTIDSSELRAQLAQLGDVAELPRMVDHFAFFDSRESAESAARALAVRGLEMASLVDDRADAHPWHLHLRGEHAVDADTIGEVCDAIFDAVDERGGVYDGWGCGITKPPPKTPARKGFLGRLFGG